MYSFIPLPVLTECPLRAQLWDASGTRPASHSRGSCWEPRGGSGAGGRNRPVVGDEPGRAFPGRDMAPLSGKAGLFCSNEELSSEPCVGWQGAAILNVVVIVPAQPHQCAAWSSLRTLLLTVHCPVVTAPPHPPPLHAGVLGSRVVATTHRDHSMHFLLGVFL